MNISSRLQDKISRLSGILARMGSVAIGFSGGVDSAVLCRVARDTLGEKAYAVTLVSDFLARCEKKDAERLARKLKLRRAAVRVRLPRRCLENPPDRCYHCKKLLFQRLQRFAREKNIAWVLDGSNADDLKELRPGRKALEQLGVRSPLQEAGLTKQDIRMIARNKGIDIWDKPAHTCLATRIPAGVRITPKNLAMVERAEEVLHGFGFRTLRVRCHGDIARIEVPQEDIARLIRTAPPVVARLETIGFRHVTADLGGCRGSLSGTGRIWKRKK